MFIEVDGLKKYFPLRDGSLASRPASFARWTASALTSVRALFWPVGESGSGETTVRPNPAWPVRERAPAA